MNRSRGYAQDWDEYVRRWRRYVRLDPTIAARDDLEYPGDEWGNQADWDRHAELLLLPYLPKDGSGIAVELGSGSGKYTLSVVDRVSRVICFDVSEKFMEVASQRLEPYVRTGKVQFELLMLENRHEIAERLSAAGVLEQVDLVFSVDAMQHVELHTLMAYWIGAWQCLKPGGHLAMTVATCTSDEGFRRLQRELDWCYGGARPSLQFYYLSRDIVLSCMGRLGFEVVTYEEDRDINFVVRKARATSRATG